MITLTDKKNRKILNEGRSFQMGFAFLKKVSEGNYETVMPISACKDYLNDVVWSEHTNKPISAHGFSYSKVGIFDSDTAYLVISIIPFLSGNEYQDQKKDTENLKNNYKNLQGFINYIEKLLLIENETEIAEIEENKYLVKFSYDWCKGTYLISLYTLLLRAGQFYKDEDPLEFLEKFSAFGSDVYMVQDMFHKLKKLIEKGFPEQNLAIMTNNYEIHNCGIITYQI